MENKKLIIELLQEIKQEQQKLNKRFDEMDGKLEFLTGKIGKLSIYTGTPTMGETKATMQNLEAFEQITGETLNIPILEKVSFENLEVLWNHVLSLASQEVSKPSFDTWIKPAKLLSYNESNSTVTVATPNAFARDWLENHYNQLIKEILTLLTDKEVSIEIIVQKEQESN